MADNVVGGIEVLHGKVRDAANLSKDDAVRFCIVGMHKQSLIALESRLLIVKHGFMAGATGGARKSTFDYADITNVEVNTGWVNGVIEVLSAAYSGGTQKDFWNSGDNNDPHKASNAIPFAKAKLADFQPYLDELNGWVREAKQARNAPAALSASEKSLPEQIRELHELVELGALSQEEFESAKKKLLA